MDSYGNDKIISTILSIVKYKLNIKFDENLKEVSSQSLFGPYFKLQAYEFAYLIMELKKAFNIDITEKDILEYHLYKINDLRTLINNRQAST